MILNIYQCISLVLVLYTVVYITIKYFNHFTCFLMMSCKCCVSLRGLAYFGASTHIVVGAMFFVEFLESLFSINQSKLMQQTETINIGTERLVYHWVFLSLGLLIFQGIDRESKTLLKRTTIIFLILQALTLAVRFKYGYMYSTLAKNPFDPCQPVTDIYRNLGLSILATVAYLMILFLYVRKLESNIHGGRLFRSPNSTTATHIPLSTTSLGWYGQSRSSSRSNNNNNNNNSSGALYSPLGNFFGGVLGGAGGFNPLVWTNPGPPPPYSDSTAPLNSEPHPLNLNRNGSTNSAHHHPHLRTQPCSSRTMTSSMMTPNENTTDSKVMATSRNPERTDHADPSVVPLLEDENDENKNGLDC